MTSDAEAASQLSDAVELEVAKVRTKSLDISFNELLDMYQSKELTINPEYQRLFRWSEVKQSQFMESLILEMPVPPLFVIEVKDRVYELIDGLQRVSSYLHFRGSHPDKVDGGGALQSLTLKGCDIIPGLNGRTFDALPNVIKTGLKRSFVRVEVIKKGSDKNLRYQMFKRLNEGGELLSDQELRNCTIRILGETFIKWIIDRAALEQFRSTIENVSDENVSRKYDQELVLRFVALKNAREQYVHDVGDFLTEYLEGVTKGGLPFDYDAEKENFERTFKVLAKSLESRAFAPANRAGTIVQGFAVYHFEAITLALQKVLAKINPESEDDVKKLGDALATLKNDAEFRRLTTGGGKNSRSELKRRIECAEAALGAAFP